MRLLSVYDSKENLITSKSLPTLLSMMKSDNFKEKIEQLRHSFRKDKDEDFHRLKLKIPRFSVGGCYHDWEGRRVLKNYSRLLLFHIRYIPPVQYDGIRKLLMQDPHVYGCFRDAIGLGMIIIVKSSLKREDHALAHRIAKNYLRLITGINRFSSMGEKLDDLCMVSHDPRLYLNVGAIPLPTFYSKRMRA